MRILVLASLAYSLVNFRAALLREMVAEGHEVIACAPDEDPATIAELAAMGVRFTSVPMDRAGTNPIRDLATLRALVRTVRRQNIRHNSRRRLAECGPRQGVDVRRRTCGAASADVRWSVA
ncbi:hypothetical protein CA242_22685, partial [Sphingomonas koreensis]